MGRRVARDVAQKLNPVVENKRAQHLIRINRLKWVQSMREEKERADRSSPSRSPCRGGLFADAGKAAGKGSWDPSAGNSVGKGKPPIPPLPMARFDTLPGDFVSPRPFR